MSLTRRAFLKTSVAVGGTALTAQATQEQDVTFRKLPRWRGFNLQPKFMVHNNRRFKEEDFAWISEFGFDFARFPMDYRCWTEKDDWTKLVEAQLKEIDEGVALGEKHGLHVCLNFHRAPGYTVAQPPEPKPLWDDEEAQRVCALHWSTFAHRYQGVPNSRLSFNLFNEPAKVAPDKHRVVVERVVEAIREEDPGRLIFCDGRMWGGVPPRELLGLEVAGATRGYEPHRLTHYQASWSGSWEGVPTPTWPLEQDGQTRDRDWIDKRYIRPWKAFESEGPGVMVGEFGAYNKTPHDVVMRWMRDCLELWKDAGWGWALWNFHGSFGIIDSERPGAEYEDWRGHKLDRKMLTLLQQH